MASRVHAEGEFRIVLNLQCDAGGVGDDDGTEGEGVCADGGDDEASAVGREDGSSAGERVGRGACGRRHDDAVAGIGGHIEFVDKDLGAKHGRFLGPVEEDLVEGEF